MPKIVFTRDWSYAHHGITVERFKAGQEADVSDACAKSALEEKAALDPLAKTKAPSKKSGKADDASSSPADQASPAQTPKPAKVKSK